MTSSAAAALLVALVAVAGEPAQDPSTSPSTGGPSISVHVQAAALADVLPEQDAAELRPQVTLSIEAQPNRRIRLRFDARAEALAADRGEFTTDVAARITEAWFEVQGRRADLRAGLGRLPWGRLDEVSPSDVINPIDAARFVIEGRSVARLPVAFVRGRLFPSETLTIEGVLAPIFERGRFDELDEPTSPFNLVNDRVLPAGVTVLSRVPEQQEPPITIENVSGGGRVLMTFRRVDVTALVYRGFESFGPTLFELLPPTSAGPAVVGRLVERHPRFTVVGADVETVTGEWVWRGEVVASVEKSLAGETRPGLVDGRALDVGAGFDRRAGEYRVYGAVLAHREWSAADPAIARTDVSIVGSIDRPFARDRYLARGFAVVNPGDGSAFLRGLLRWRATDRAAVETSAGTFLGTSDDRIGQFRDRDFAFVRFSYDF